MFFFSFSFELPIYTVSLARKCIHYIGDWVADFLIAWVFEFSIYSTYALLDVKLENIFSNPSGFLSTQLTISFAVQKLFNFIKNCLSIIGLIF